MVKLPNFIGAELHFTMKHRILNIILLSGCLISFWSALVCSLLRMNNRVVLACVGIGTVLFGIYYLSRVKKKYNLCIFLALVLPGIVVPFVWFSQGGISGGVPLYLMLFSPMGAILLDGYKRFVLTSILTVLTIALIGIEYVFPHLVIGHPSQTVKYIDVSVALITSIIANSLLLTLILRNYDKEHQRAKKYLLQSETAREHLQYLSFHDTLTGLFNRTFFEAELHRLEAAGAKRIAVAVIDIDGLKFVNDTLGHWQGDEMISRAAGILKTASSENTLIFRTGGDEFIVLFQEASREKLESFYKAMHEQVARDNEITNSVIVPLQISVGYAYSEDNREPLRELLVKAENKMYREKLLHHASGSQTMIQTVKEMMSARDYSTGEHADRLENIIVAFAKAVGVPDSAMSELRLFAKFHDIGKIGISDQILLKPGRFTEEEKHEMQKHCEIGYRIASSTADLLPIAGWILRHHEWWNGTGYVGLSGSEIPFECRLLAVADSYDAMTSDRPYRKAMAHDKAIEELRRYAGIQFDPELVAVFSSLELSF